MKNPKAIFPSPTPSPPNNYFVCKVLIFVFYILGFLPVYSSPPLPSPPPRACREHALLEGGQFPAIGGAGALRQGPFRDGVRCAAVASEGPEQGQVKKLFFFLKEKKN